jgi:hypothetical protein
MTESQSAAALPGIQPAEQPYRNPLLSEEGDAALFSEDIDFAFEEGTGELVAVRREESEPEPAQSTPEDQARQLLEADDPEANLMARLKGLQSKITPTFQEKARLERELAEARQRIERLEAGVEGERSAAHAAQTNSEIQEAIAQAVKEASNEDGYLDAEALSRALSAALPRTLEVYTKKVIGSKLEAVDQLQNQLQMAQRTNRLLSEYGPKLPLMAQVVKNRLDQDPGLRERFTPEELLRQAHDDLALLAQQQHQQHQQHQQVQPDQPDPEAAARAARERALSNATDVGVSPGPGAPSLPSARPRTLEDAVLSAMKSTSFIQD